jgi:uncharacterized protein
MKWRRRKDSPDVIDIRGAGKRGGGGGGGMQVPGGSGGLPIPGGMAGGGGGIGLIILVVLFILLKSCGGSGGGFDLPDVIGPGATAPGADKPQPIPPGEDPQKDIKDFSVYVFEDVQDTWRQIFKAAGQPYDNSQLVLYSGAVNTGGCGSATSAVGPFYCPPDNRVYLDLSFYDEMKQQLDAPGDFAWAYVIAHEMGHHTQDLAGTSNEVEQQSRDNPDDANELSVRLELQADCYAGVWGATVFKEGALEEGDIDEAFNAAEAVGDDRLLKKAGNNSPDPDSFTHGTSEQRRSWFTKGYESGDPDSCDTFSPDSV